MKLNLYHYLHYDQLMYRPMLREYYHDSGFFNFGFWSPDTRDQREACENLMERLLAFLPQREGTILDVACGLAGTTRYLLKYYPPRGVVATNVSPKQLATARSKAPGCQFLSMDATRMAFRDACFDNIICVESSFNFNTREEFLAEAYRLLKPGGRLLLSDILFRRIPENPLVPTANFVRDLGAYREMYLRVGFRDVEVVEAIEECWRGFRRHFLRWVWRRFRRRRDVSIYRRCRALVAALLWAGGFDLIASHYPLVSARKV